MESTTMKERGPHGAPLPSRDIEVSQETSPAENLVTNFPFHTHPEPGTRGLPRDLTVSRNPGGAATGTLVFKSRSVRLLGTPVTIEVAGSVVNSHPRNRTMLRRTDGMRGCAESHAGCAAWPRPLASGPRSRAGIGRRGPIPLAAEGLGSGESQARIGASQDVAKGSDRSPSDAEHRSVPRNLARVDPTDRIPVSRLPGGAVLRLASRLTLSHTARSGSYWYTGFQVSLGPTSRDTCDDRGTGKRGQ